MADAFDGLSLTSGATATVTTPASPVAAPTVVNKAIPLPLPTLVKGRET
jgi:hypothetical protein